MKTASSNFFLQLLIAVLFLGPLFSLAATDENILLKTVAMKYKNAALVQMAVEKTVLSEVLSKETHYVGKIFLSEGKFRWENSKPEKTLLVFDGETIWNEQSAPDEFPGPPQVAKAKLDHKNKSKVLIGALLNGASILKEFKIISIQKSGENVVYEVEPNGNKDICKNLNITVNTREKNITAISFMDDVGNKTQLKFQDIKFLSSGNKTIFKYVAPKGAIVTNL